METTTTSLDAPQRVGPVRLLLVLALLVLSPIAAESLVGYDDTTGNALALLAGLVVFIPLYGAPAVLLREAARRFGLGWGAVLAIAAALGVVQAGIIDQSMFSEDYRGIDYWQELVGPTWIPAFGFAASTALTFVLGHMIMSFAAPIAVVEGLGPRSADRPWLRPFGLIVTVLLYLAGAWMVLDWHYETETDHASAGQLAGAGAVAALLIVLALAFGRRKAVRVERRIPPLWVLVAASAVAVFSFGLYETWAWVAVTAGMLCAAGLAAAYFARSTAWGRRQVTAIAIGALLSQALTGFLATPIGDVDPVAKYGHNTAAVLLIAVLGWFALRRTR
ncbi:hypothetical protein [Glycomyces algeriensis]|uniref:Uncharacterized protein n=1 Tax=Glycomyces algeriensis TaxID=256037 RepID=A0A9W6LIQ4_9ACTN|nr:hypothetical protein [Glycomyces algeriensis]MDA1368270.1 hypothetical protein [Glycomyces algeriensis]MDR7351910.1 hypothetical protein [Glycomyces algeriensis]GLI44640.1 hypothetical protein GALLR39Z86_44900 [Glycomyces algeriensis]